jgi:hypothetical protein
LSYTRVSKSISPINDDSSWTLPMPIRFVIGQGGIILYSERNPDYSRRPEPEDMFPVLERAKAVKA